LKRAFLGAYVMSRPEAASPSEKRHRAELMPARQAVYHDARYPSCITLPVMPRL
jgi:hypothetical protein